MDNTHLVALSARLATNGAAAAAAGLAVAGDVAGLAAAVAGLGVLGALGAITAWFIKVREYSKAQQRAGVLTHVTLA
jgi:hypothetical protein